MALDQHWKDEYSDSVTYLAGQQFKNRLGERVEHESVKGINAWFDAYEPLDEASDDLVTDDSGKYRMEYEEAGATTFAAWYDLQTPHTQITKTRTQCPSRIIEAGYVFRKLDEVAENSSPQSKVLRTIMRQVVKKEDANILNVITANTAFRGRDLDSGAAVNFPTAQVLSITAGISAFDKDVVAQVAQKFEENFLDGERVFQVITPAMKSSLIINSGDTIQSSDFIDHGHHHMENYTLPEVYNVHMIVHPLMSAYSTSILGSHAEGISVAFTMEWGYWNKAEALTTQIDQDPGQRFSFVLYICEFCNAVRVDDKRVVIIGFGAVT